MDLNFKSFGQGPPLVILHGLFGTLDNWQTLGKRWAEDFTVFLVDQRNHGRSPHADVIDYPTMAADLKEFLEHNWIYETHLLGHSMGGKTAMQFALDYPDLVDRLVVVDIAPREYPGGHQVIFEALFDLDLATLDDRREADALLARRIPQRGIRQFLLKNLTRSRDGGYAWKMNLPAIRRHYPDILANIVPTEVFTGPALFIRGDKSDYVTDADWPATHDLFPNARLETIAGAGHWVHAEQPDVLYRLVREFLLE
jgi:pimeloyl-ACP methyl ester carboxylesterase